MICIRMLRRAVVAVDDKDGKPRQVDADGHRQDPPVSLEVAFNEVQRADGRANDEDDGNAIEGCIPPLQRRRDQNPTSKQRTTTRCRLRNYADAKYEVNQADE